MTRWFPIFMASATFTVADEAVGIQYFETHIRPLLISECYQCHSLDEKVKGGLRLDWRGGWQMGGDSGPAIVPGSPNESLLLRAIQHLEESLTMPPKKRLKDDQIQRIADWITMGAPDPRLSEYPTAEEKARDLQAAREFWAFRPVVAPPLPTVEKRHWVRTGLDHFILAALESRDIAPNPDAGPHTLLRRIYFDLIGVPPEPEEITTFVNAYHENREEALSAIVDELLSRPSFGVRWGRHWLDVARFSESTGGGRTLLMTEAWRYRDYVVNAFNADKPYDQFIREQIAGDLLPGGTLEDRQERIVATAFLLLGPTNYELQDKTVLEMDIIDEQLDTLGKAFLGLTIGCARCHDHKFDPITTEDYYGLAGILKGTQSVIHSNVSTWNKRPLPMAPERETLAQSQSDAIAKLDQNIASLKKALEGQQGEQPIVAATLPGIIVDNAQATTQGSWSASNSVKSYVDSEYLYTGGDGDNRLVLYPANIPRTGTFEIRLSYAPHPNRSTQTLVTVRHADGETTHRINQRVRPPVNGYFVSLGTYDLQEGASEIVEISNQGADGVVVADAIQVLTEDEAKKTAPATDVTEPTNTELQAAQRKLTELENQKKQLTKHAIKRTLVIAANDAENTGDIAINLRGDANNLGAIAPRQFIEVLQTRPIPSFADGESGRKQLADWLSHSEHPLTARVLVNRIWHHLFGAGIVESVDNFGHMGRTPSNEALLNYLALRFVKQGWSVKALIREIILSRTYRLASETTNAASLSADVENQLVWRQNRRRLQAESIRDAMLRVSDQLDTQLGGPTIKPGTKIEYGYKFEGTRRSLYTPVFRNTPLELLAVFDFADPNIVVGKRANSSVATQALYLMNSSFVKEQSQYAARRHLSQPTRELNTLIEQAYLRSLSRPPTLQERQLIRRFVESNGTNEKTWTQVFHGLFASLEFRHLE